MEGGAYEILTKDDRYESKETNDICNILLDGVNLAKSLLNVASWVNKRRVVSGIIFAASSKLADRAREGLELIAKLNCLGKR